MRSKLGVRLIGAFAIVILAGAIITYAVAVHTVSRQSNRYFSRRDQLHAASLAPFFADYFLRTGTWEDVDTFTTGLSDLETSTERGGGWGGGGGQGNAQRRSQGFGGWENDRLLLANAGGQIVLDTSGERTGQLFPQEELAEGVPISVEGRQVGTLLVVPTQSGSLATLTSDFLAALNRGVLLATIGAGLVAILIGAILVRHIISPLHNLRSAANAIAEGDLSQRVPTISRDELGDVGRAFNHMADRLERDERLRQHMMADIAHELRTPLTVIRGQVEALLDGVFPLTLDQLTPVHDQIILLSRLVSDLRDLALAEAGQLKLERQPTDLGDLARRVVAAVEPIAGEKGVSLSVVTTPDLPRVLADQDRFKQVFHNLLNNALNHTPSGGQVKVSIKPAVITDPVPYLLVSVSDTGSGIAEEDIPYIFDRFYRSRTTRSRASGGSGLGLSVVRTIVEAHGGQASAASQPGVGTQITFTIPVTT